MATGTKINDKNLNEIFNELAELIEDKLNTQKQKGNRFIFDKNNPIVIDEERWGELYNLKEKIQRAGYIVEVIENLDADDVGSKSKFSILISNKDGCFVKKDLFDYRKTMLTYGESEEDEIEDILMHISGVQACEKREIASNIADYLSYACHFNELQIKEFKDMGWATYDEEDIFKYDRIYQSNMTVEADDSNETICKRKLLGRYIGEYKDALSVNIDNPVIRNKIIFNWIKDFLEVWEYDSSVINKKEQKPYNSMILAAACSGLIRPVVSPTKESNININVVGERASGKSTICHFALSLFGNPKELEGSFSDSEEAAEITRAKRPVVPYILDERMLRVEGESDNKKHMKILMNVFREYEGKVKERLTGKGNELSGVRTYAPVISSSVESMMDILLQSDRDLGQYRRFIEIEIRPEDLFNNGEMAQKIENVALSEYGFGVELIVQFILDIGIETLKTLHNKVLEEVNKKLEERETFEKNNGYVNVNGLKSSALRFALIVTTAVVIENAIKDWISTNKTFIVQDTTEVKSLNEISMKIENRVILNRAYKVLDILIDNLVDKMKRVNLKLEVYTNAQKFISRHKALFAPNVTKLREKSKDYIGYLEEKGDITEIGFRANRGYEWLICWDKLEKTDEEILGYIKCVDEKIGSSTSTTVFKAVIEEELLSFAGIDYRDNFERVIMLKDKERFKIEKGHELGIGKGNKIFMSSDKIDPDKLNDSDKEKGNNKKAESKKSIKKQATEADK